MRLAFRYVLPVVLGSVSLAIVLGGCSRESSEEPAPAVEVSTAEVSTAEVSAPEPPASGDAVSGDAGDRQEAQAPGAQNSATAEMLTSLGLMPFESPIPSEDFRLATLDGGQASLSDYRGEVVLLNFWATWCPPCREEMPSMQELYQELSEEGLEIVAVDVQEPAETVQAFVNELGLTFPILLDANGAVAMRYGIRAFPTTYVIDRNGNVLGGRPGYHDWSTPAMMEGFRKLLEL